MGRAVVSRALALGACVVLVAGCGGGGSSADPSSLTIAKASGQNGDQQSGLAGQALANDLRIVVTRDGSPESGVTVTWSTTSGTLVPTSAPSDLAGIGFSTWTVGSTPGTQTAQAAIPGASGSPITFTATVTSTAPPPPSAVAVTVGNNFFLSQHNGTTNPAIDTVAVGGTVTWTWTNTKSTQHSVQSTGATLFTSSVILSGNGQIYAFQFDDAGTYTYNCAVHGAQMTGRIVVRPGASP
jgi:plastocyanin